MKYQFKRGLSMMLVLMMIISLLSGLTITADATTYSYNQGQRGTTATSLTTAAVNFYKDNKVTYEELAMLSGASSIDSVPSSALYKELQSLMIEKHTHETTYDETRDLYKYTDCQNGGGKISTFYSGKDVGPDWDSGSTWNREHCWPKSKTSTSEKAPANSDLMSLRPADSSTNSSRGNTAYGQSSGYYDPNSEADGKYNVRGDAARIILYSYTRWGTYTASYMWGSSGVMESKDVLLSWMEEDPVDTWELSRNDIVQSITGTRNVFVDYPELAFLMFGEAIPAGMTTPSGEAAKMYTITATSNNDEMGTASITGNLITAAPAEGYRASGYEVVSGNATVTRDGDTFKVVAYGDCTIRINFEAKTPATITYKNNTTVISTETTYIDDTITLPGYTGDVPTGYSFAGWTEALVSDTELRPAYTREGESYLVSGETDLYALFTYAVEDESGSEIWSQVTAASDLYSGAKVVLADGSYNVVAGELTKASNGYYLKYLDAVFSADQATITSLPADAVIFTLGSNAGAWTIENSDGQKLGATALKTLAFGDGTTTWEISITDGNAMISNSNADYGTICYNFSSPRFTTYSYYADSEYYELPQLYILSGGETTYYTTAADKEPEPDYSGRCPLCVMAEKNPLFQRHIHMRPRNP